MALYRLDARQAQQPFNHQKFTREAIHGMHGSAASFLDVATVSRTNSGNVVDDGCCKIQALLYKYCVRACRGTDPV